MNKTLVGIIAVFVIAGAAIVGLHESRKSVVVPPPNQERVIGATAGTDHYNLEQFYAGLAASYFKTTTSGSSSSSPAALSSTSSGHFIVAASATTANASTTAITASSDKVFIEQEGTTPIAGTTCNTALASGTSVSLVVVSSTSTNNGFTTKVQPAPTTNPYCFAYFILK